MDTTLLAQSVLFHSPEVWSIIRSFLVEPHDVDDADPCTGLVSPTPVASVNLSFCTDDAEVVDDHVIFAMCNRGGGGDTPQGHSPKTP